MSDLLTTADAARILGVVPATVRQTGAEREAARPAAPRAGCACSGARWWSAWQATGHDGNNVKEPPRSEGGQPLMDTHEAAPITLERLRANEQYQPREAGLDERHVRLLLATDTAAWPSLLVTPNELGGVDVVDGFHRLEAARRAGLAALSCVVGPTAGYPEAVAANLRHGLPLALADRKDFARWLREDDPTLSLRELGRRSGLNHETVKRALDGVQDGGGENRRDARPNRDPVTDLVRRTVRAYAEGRGRTWLGFGKAGTPRPFRRAIEAYGDEERPAVARALDAFGRACVEAAAPYLDGPQRP